MMGTYQQEYVLVMGMYLLPLYNVLVIGTYLLPLYELVEVIDGYYPFSVTLEIWLFTITLLLG